MPFSVSRTVRTVHQGVSRKMTLSSVLTSKLRRDADSQIAKLRKATELKIKPLKRRLAEAEDEEMITRLVNRIQSIVQRTEQKIAKLEATIESIRKL
jgi:hypothetical protein